MTGLELRALGSAARRGDQQRRPHRLRPSARASRRRSIGSRHSSPRPARRTAPDLFPTSDDALAYWINAYNAFTLHAIDGRVSDHARCGRRATGSSSSAAATSPAGARSASTTSSTRSCAAASREPRIHFAINCGSNGCPPMRPAGLRAATACATRCAAPPRQFLASEWNCRVDHDARRIFISRLFKMYAEDFAGAQGTHEDYRARRAALRRRAHRARARDASPTTRSSTTSTTGA